MMNQIESFYGCR